MSPPGLHERTRLRAAISRRAFRCVQTTEGNDFDCFGPGAGSAWLTARFMARLWHADVELAGMLSGHELGIQGGHGDFVNIDP